MDYSFTSSVMKCALHKYMYMCLQYRLSGQVGYVTANVKSSTGTLVGDTMNHKSEPVEPLPGFRPAKAMVGQCQVSIWLVIGQLADFDWYM